ncbi:MAG: VCBS repeat-containing protein [Thermoguttaceae bacterium]|nr:VCBS repeat-containing protein [Thermoguttaceae bacterium]
MRSNKNKFHGMILALFMAFFLGFVDGDAFSEEGLERVEMNNPEADAFLAVGLWSWVVPADVDSDGNTDLIISCEDVPYNGVWYFRNIGDDLLHPTFDKAKKLSKGVINVQPSWIDGKLRVLTPGYEYPDFIHTGVDKPVALKSGEENLPINVHVNNVRGNMWRLVDYDDDGLVDIVVGSDDWTDYGWDDAYSDDGVWKNGPLRGNVYLLRNIGSNDVPVYEKPTMLKDLDGNVLETFGWPSPNFADWDGDGDLDIIGIEFRDTIQYAENVGTRTEPKYKPFAPVCLEDGKPAAAELAMPTIVAYDWDKDGDLDVLLGDEDGRIALFVNTGRLNGSNQPLFEAPFYFKQVPDLLKCGALSTPWGVDWDDDGDWDIISGNSAGYIFFLENLSGPGVDPPKWATPVALSSEPNDQALAETASFIPKTSSLVEKRRDGTVSIRIMAGPNGSIQGPCEPKWGYTTLSVADWDGDGLKDIVVNSILGNVLWYKNVGEKGAPKLAQPQVVEVEWEGEAPELAWGWRKPEGKELLTQWRTTPVAVDFNSDGLTDLVSLDTEGYLAFFERFRTESGDLRLASPKRVFVDPSGSPLRLNAGRAGASGRRKICFCDYNRDGKLDLLANNRNADLYLQTKAEDGLYYFVLAGEVDSRPIRGHSTSPTVVDFNNDGVMDPFIGAEDGHFYYKHNDWKEGQTGAIRFESDELVVESSLQPATLKDGAKAYANRDYQWFDVVPEISGRQYLQTNGGVSCDVVVRAKKDVTVEFLVGTTWPIDKSPSYLVESDRKGFNATKKVDVAASSIRKKDERRRRLGRAR